MNKAGKGQGDDSAVTLSLMERCSRATASAILPMIAHGHTPGSRAGSWHPCATVSLHGHTPTIPTACALAAPTARIPIPTSTTAVY